MSVSLLALDLSVLYLALRSWPHLCPVGGGAQLGPDALGVPVLDV